MSAGLDRDVALICNPSAGGGRAAKALPRAERALSELGVRFHTELTRSLEHGCELARTAAAAGEATVTLSGDGLIGCVVGALRDVPGAVLGILPGGRGNDTARMLTHPVQARGRLRGHRRRRVARDRRRRRRGPLVHRDRLAGLRFRRQPDRQRRALAAGQARLRLRRDARARGLEDGPLRAARRRRAGHEHRLLGRRLQLRLLRRRDARRARRRRSTTACSTSCSSPRTPSRAFSPTCRASSRARTSRHPAVRVLRARELRVDADRPFTVYADGDPIGDTPLTIRVIPHAVRVLVPA